MITNHFCERCEAQGLEVYDYLNKHLEKPGFLRTKCLVCEHKRDIQFKSFDDDFIKEAVNEILKYKADSGLIDLEAKGDGTYYGSDGSMYYFGKEDDYKEDDCKEEGFYGEYNDPEWNDGYDDNCG